MKFNIEHNVKFNLKVEIKNFVPERQAPFCNNPSSTLYSAPGDPMEFDYVLYIVDEEGIKHELPEQLDFLYDDDDLFDKIVDKIIEETYE